MLNTLWLGFFVAAAVACLAQWLVGGNAQVFAAMVESLFAMAKLSVEVMVLLFGTLTLWLGFLRIAEKAGIVHALARWLHKRKQVMSIYWKATGTTPSLKKSPSSRTGQRTRPTLLRVRSMSW